MTARQARSSGTTCGGSGRRRMRRGDCVAAATDPVGDVPLLRRVAEQLDVAAYVVSHRGGTVNVRTIASRARRCLLIEKSKAVDVMEHRRLREARRPWTIPRPWPPGW